MKGWRPSYPETTGYIIPTFLSYSKAYNDSNAKERALLMAKWEIEVQLPNGAVTSGHIGRNPSPAVFNTGQVLFGWISAYLETNDDQYLLAIQRAAKWLLEIQDDDGAWRKFLSGKTDTKVQTYNIRSAWGLALAGVMMGKSKWIEAATKNAEWVLKQENEKGWFSHCTFYLEEDSPLLHTISYTLEGLLGLGLLFKNHRYIESVVKSSMSIIKTMKKYNGLKGRYDSSWRPTVHWRCLSGEAQFAIVLYRLAIFSSDFKYFTKEADSILRGLLKYQDIQSPHPESFGAISGSQPIWGRYDPFFYQNWAAKFLMDALLLFVSGIDSQPVIEW